MAIIGFGVGGVKVCRLKQRNRTARTYTHIHSVAFARAENDHKSLQRHISDLIMSRMIGNGKACKIGNNWK